MCSIYDATSWDREAATDRVAKGRGSDVDQLYEMRSDKLNGRVEAVTVTSPPFGTNSETFFCRFGRVAASSCGGAWK